MTPEWNVSRRLVGLSKHVLLCDPWFRLKFVGVFPNHVLFLGRRVKTCFCGGHI